jgi:hypothetical protein
MIVLLARWSTVSWVLLTIFDQLRFLQDLYLWSSQHPSDAPSAGLQQNVPEGVSKGATRMGGPFGGHLSCSPSAGWLEILHVDT